MTKSRTHWPKAKYGLTSSGQFLSYKCDVFTKKIGIDWAIFLYRLMQNGQNQSCDTIALKRRKNVATPID